MTQPFPSRVASFVPVYRLPWPSESELNVDDWTTTNAKANNPLRSDPTRTATLRKSFEADFVRRFAKFRQKLVSLIVDEDAFGLKQQNQSLIPTINSSFASTQLNVTDPECLRRIRELQGGLDPTDVIELETVPHVTVRYGLHGQDPEAVREIVTEVGPVWITLGRLSLFQQPEHDVLKLDVESKGLERLNAELGKLPNTQTHDEYHPHLTAAYLKPGTGWKYLSDPSFLEWQSYVFTELTFSDRERIPTELSLNCGGKGGKPGPCPIPVAGIIIPANHKMMFSNKEFKLEDDEELVAHQTAPKFFKSIEQQGLKLGTGKVGAWSGSAGDTNLWFWKNPGSVLQKMKSANQGVVVFAVKKSDIVHFPDTAAAFVRQGVSSSKIAFMTKTQKPLDLALNVFCPTGKGGGVDPSCSPGKGKTGTETAFSNIDMASSILAKQQHLLDTRVFGGPQAERLDRAAVILGYEDNADLERFARGLLTPEAQTLGNTIRDFFGEDYGASVRSDPIKNQVLTELGLHQNSDLPTLYRVESQDPGLDIGSSWHPTVALSFSTRERVIAGSVRYIIEKPERGTRVAMFSQYGRREQEVISLHPQGYTVKHISHDNYGVNYHMIPNQTAVTNTRWSFRSSPEKITEFLKWLQQNLQPILTDPLTTDDDWWNKYIQAGFKKGAARSYDDMKKAGAIPQSNLPFYLGQKDEFLKSAFRQPESINKVKMLAGRVYTELNGVTEAMSQNLSRALTDGLVQGMNPRQIATNIVKVVEDIGIRRARVIARTEIIRAHAEGQLDAMERLGVKKLAVMVEWNTAGDARVCKLCQPLEGIVVTIDEAKGLIPRHPQCRCAFIPANVGEDPAEQVRGAAKIKKAITKSLVAGKPKKGKSKSSWAGARRKISKFRPKSKV